MSVDNSEMMFGIERYGKITGKNVNSRHKKIISGTVAVECDAVVIIGAIMERKNANIIVR